MDTERIWKWTALGLRFNAEFTTDYSRYAVYLLRFYLVEHVEKGGKRREKGG
jgi:hypothetical protein